MPEIFHRTEVSEEILLNFSNEPTHPISWFMCGGSKLIKSIFELSLGFAIV